MLQGSFCDARETLQNIELPEDAPLSGVVVGLARLADRFSNELSSKESALAKAQTARPDLEGAQESLQEKEARYRTTLASIGDGLISTDELGCVEFMNPVAERLTGWTTDQARGLPVGTVFHTVNAETRVQIENPVVHALQEGTVVSLGSHAMLIARDGTERQVADSCAPIRDGGDKLLGAVLVFRDVTEEYLRREQLRESEERYRTLFEGVGEGILVADVETKVLLHCNRTWCEMFGYTPEEVLRLRVPDIHPEDAVQEVIAEFEAQARGEKILVSDLPCRRKDGTVFFSDIRTTALHLNGRLCNVGFFTDASKRKSDEKKLETEKSLREKAEVELLHAQKLQAVGQLAAGVAHEINTPIQFVGDNVHFLSNAFADVTNLLAQLQRLESGWESAEVAEGHLSAVIGAASRLDISFLQDEVPRAIDQTLQGVERVATIVRAMKDFSHPDCGEKVTIDVNRALETTLTVARNELKYVADVTVDFDNALPMISGYAGELNQVFLNLLINAAHAIQDVVGNTGQKGVITVRTVAVESSVLISVSDTGSGIPAEIRHRVFDPFFTTKSVGEGTGQGLAIARSVVVEKHGGKIWFATEAEHGTTFYVRLPVQSQEAVLI
jgi:PAS domain S-box-containing protein